MTTQILPDSLSVKERETWQRIIERRRSEWEQLNPSVLEAIIRVPWSQLTVQPAFVSSKEKFDWLLSKCFERSVNSKILPSKRRAALLLVKKLLEKSDKAWNQHGNDQDACDEIELEIDSSNTENGVSLSKIITTCQMEQGRATQLPKPHGIVHAPGDRRSSSDPFIASLPDPLPALTLTSANPATKSAAKNFDPISAATSSTSPNNSTLFSPSLPTGLHEHLGTVTATSKVPTPDILTTITVPQQLIHPTNEQSLGTNGVASSHNRMGAAQSSASATSEVSNHNSHSQERTNPREQEPGERKPSRSPSLSRVCTPDLATPPSHIMSSNPMTIFFPPDDNKYYGGLTARPVIKTLHRPKNLTTDEMNKISFRFATWDPYWKMEEILVLQQTCQLDYCDLRKDTNVPVNRAVGCKFQLTPNQMALVSGWGDPRDKKQYDHNEARLLVRMIPLQEPTKKPEKDKKTRADYHIWPKGTFLSICGIATQIKQRKQTSYDQSYWQGPSEFLDVTSHVFPKSSARPELSIDVCCFENKPYVICIAICRFHKPAILYDILMANAIDKLPMKEAVQIALKMTAQNMVILDEAEGDDENGSFILKLSCAISSSLMHTPVRAKKCKHFQCFDLQNFLEVNQHVSGTRWECPVCNTKLISVYELEHCSLTKSLLNQYKNLASAHQDRVEFFSDGTWQLLDEMKKRHGVKRNQIEPADSRLAMIPMVAEVIDLL